MLRKIVQNPRSKERPTLVVTIYVLMDTTSGRCACESSGQGNIIVPPDMRLPGLFILLVTKTCHDKYRLCLRNAEPKALLLLTAGLMVNAIATVHDHLSFNHKVVVHESDMQIKRPVVKRIWLLDYFISYAAPRLICQRRILSKHYFHPAPGTKEKSLAAS